MCFLLAAGRRVFAQDPTGAIEGAINDRTGSAVPAATIAAGSSAKRVCAARRRGREQTVSVAWPLLPIGTYRGDHRSHGLRHEPCEPIPVNREPDGAVDVQLELSAVTETVTVSGRAQLVDTSTNALGRSSPDARIVDLPLNGRNFTQLGLLQTGVAPLTAGVATAGGNLRQGQAYAVNGMRPEQNVYLVDGAQNMNRMDGGYALKLPVDAIAEFRILTQSAPPEYGGTGGATTSVVTRSGGNQFHGSLYEFVRNDAFDARNFFSEEVEPLKQNQFGAHRSADRSRRTACCSSATTKASATAGDDDQRDGADGAGAAGRFLRHGRAADQLRRRRRAVSRQPDSAGRDQSGGAQCRQPVSARQRLAVHLPRDVVGTNDLRPGRRPRRRQHVVRTTSCSPATRTRAATTSIRSRSAAPTFRGFRPATTSRRTRRRLEHPHLSTSLINSLRVT